jgi:hypothetical protein
LNGPTPILESCTPAGRARRRTSAGIITGRIAIFLIFIQSVHYGQKASGSSDVRSEVLVFVAALSIMILIHELGHLIAGWLLGFRFREIAVGPLRLWLEGSKIKMGFRREMTAMGYAGMQVGRVARLRRRLVLYASGGTAANALSLAIPAMFAYHSSFASMSPLASSFAAQFTYLSIILGFLNIMPAPLASRIASDGSRIATLLSDRKRGRRYLAICGLRAQNQKGIRPKDLRQTWLKVACSVPDESVDDFWGNWFAYRSASARSDKDEASAHLETCLRLSCLQTQNVRRMLLQEAAFFSAWFLEDVRLTNKWLAQVKPLRAMPLLTLLRLDIATHCSRNEFGEALRIWENCLAYVQSLPGIEIKRTLLGDWLDFGDQIQIRQSSAAAAPVPMVEERLSNIYEKLGVLAPGTHIGKARVSLKRLVPWLMATTCLSLPAFVLLAVLNGHKALRLVVEVIPYMCLIGLLWIKRRHLSETIRGPSTRWYLPWRSARFSMPENACIFVRAIDSVNPWYVEQLGLHKAGHIRLREYEMATYKFKEDGKSITLTTRIGYGTDKSLSLFTKRIGRMKEVLSERGIDIGPMQQDRQGTRYFEIYDPEGNVIEVVEEP